MNLLVLQKLTKIAWLDLCPFAIAGYPLGGFAWRVAIPHNLLSTGKLSTREKDHIRMPTELLSHEAILMITRGRHVGILVSTYTNYRMQEMVYYSSTYPLRHTDSRMSIKVPV